MSTARVVAILLDVLPLVLSGCEGCREIVTADGLARILRLNKAVRSVFNLALAGARVMPILECAVCVASAAVRLSHVFKHAIR